MIGNTAGNCDYEMGKGFEAVFKLIAGEMTTEELSEEGGSVGKRAACSLAQLRLPPEEQQLPFRHGRQHHVWRICPLRLTLPPGESSDLCLRPCRGCRRAGEAQAASRSRSVPQCLRAHEREGCTAAALVGDAERHGHQRDRSCTRFLSLALLLPYYPTTHCTAVTFPPQHPLLAAPVFCSPSGYHWLLFPPGDAACYSIRDRSAAIPLSLRSSGAPILSTGPPRTFSSF